MRQLLLALVSVIASVACGGGDAAPADAGVDAPDGALVFRLSHGAPTPPAIFVQSGTEAGPQDWLSLETADGARVALQRDCITCGCDQCDACGICGAGIPEVTAIARGRHRDLHWRPRLLVTGTCPSGSDCSTEEPLPAGDYVARFCWSTVSDGVGEDHEVGPTICAAVPFRFPDAASPAAPIEHGVH